MTGQDIKTAINAAIDYKLSQMSKLDSDELSGSEQTTITDACTDVLGDVNPNHTYPPVPKS